MWSLFEIFPEEFSIAILDIGAAMLKEPIYQSLIDRERAHVIGFEPDEDACQQLKDAYGEPHQFFPYFIGDGQVRTFYETNWGPTGSLFEPNTELLEKFHKLAEVTTTVATHSVQTTTIDSIEEIEAVDFFKIDVQGSELDVFKHAKNALKGTLIVQTEVELVQLYKDQPLFSDVDAFLREQGFQFLCFLGFGGRSFKPILFNNSPYAGKQQLWSDAVYVKDWLHLDKLSELQLHKYAVLLHDVFAVYDLAHVVLTALDRQTGGSIADTYLKRLVSPS